MLKIHCLETGMALSYASNIHRNLTIFIFKSAICQFVTLWLFMIVLYYDANY